MLKFLSIGSGSSGNCYYLATANDAMIIDSGVGVRNIRKHLHEYGLHLDSVKRILITHDHADHIKSVGVISSEYNIPVYATKEVHGGIERNFCVPRKIPADNKRFIEKDVTLKLGDFTVTPFAVPHDSAGNMGYFIEVEKNSMGEEGSSLHLTPNTPLQLAGFHKAERLKEHPVSFCLMTDVGHVTEDMQQYISRANYLVLEANYDKEMLQNGPYPQHLKVRIDGPMGHLSNHDCAEAIANFATQELKHVWLCHLSEENNHPVLALKTIEQVLRSYGLIMNKDFIVEDLKRKQPSLLYELE